MSHRLQAAPGPAPGGRAARAAASARGRAAWPIVMRSTVPAYIEPCGRISRADKAALGLAVVQDGGTNGFRGGPKKVAKTRIRRNGGVSPRLRHPLAKESSLN